MKNFFNINSANKEEENNEKKTKEEKIFSKAKKDEDDKVGKDIYFIIAYKKNEKENQNDFTFSKNCDILPTILLSKEINDIINVKVLKYKNIEAKESEELIFYIGEEGRDDYIITLDINEKSFIYNVDLKKEHKDKNIIDKENINQKLIDLEDKLDLFLEALKKNKEENKIQELYKETLELYSKANNFYKYKYSKRGER